MKNTVITFILTLFLLSNVEGGETSTNLVNLQDVSAAVKTNLTVQTTLNDVVIDILRGAKSAGSEIYAASKSAITQAVDFTMEQTPIVVKEFLHWKLAESVIDLMLVSSGPIFLLFMARALRKRSEDSSVSVLVPL